MDLSKSQNSHDSLKMPKNSSLPIKMVEWRGNTSSLLKCKTEKHRQDATAAIRFHPLPQRQMGKLENELENEDGLG
jgi:hypothetical protein